MNKGKFLFFFFSFLFLLGIAARIYSFAVLPESAYNDALFHLTNAKEIISTGSIPSSAETFYSPFYHLLVSISFILSGLPLSFPFFRILPIILSALFFLLFFLLSREIFKKNNLYVIASLSFLSVFSWLIRYNTVNYTETISAIFFLCSLLFLKKFIDSKNPSFFLLLAFFISILALTKFTMIFLVAALFCAALVYSLKARFPKKAILAFAAIAVFFSLFFYAINFSSSSFVLDEAINPVDNTGTLFNGSLDLLASHSYFYDLPRNLAQNLPVSLIFSVILLPLTIAVIYGFYLLLKQNASKKYLYPLIAFSAISFVFPALWFVLTESRQAGIFPARYVLPLIPILAVFFAKGFFSIKKKYFAGIILASFIFFSLYSAAFSSYSAYYYEGIYEKHAPMYEFIKSLPDNPKIFSETNGRAIGFYSGKEFGWNAEIYEMNAAQAYQELKKEGFDYIAVGCHNENFPSEKIKELQEKDFVEEVFKDNCAGVYKIKN